MNDTDRKLDALAERVRHISREIEFANFRLEIIYKEIMKMSVQLDTLEANVKRNGDVIDSAVLLIKGLADQFAAVKDDPVRIQALADQVKGKADALADAVVANTPPAPPAPPTPPAPAPMQQKKP